MSFSVIDILGSYISIEEFPPENNFLILCDESCLIPDQIGSESVSLPDIDSIRSGRLHFRISSDLQRGIIIGKLYIRLPNIKLFTPRREIFSQFLSPSSIEIIQIKAYPSAPKVNPTSPPTINSTSSSNTHFGGSGNFDIIYQESLIKYAGTFLIEKSSRARILKSAKAQLKNLVDGIIISFNRKGRRIEDFDAEQVVDEIFSDLENHEIIFNGVNLEYNDDLVHAYFDRNRSLIFQPAYKSMGTQSSNRRTDTARPQGFGRNNVEEVKRGQPQDYRMPQNEPRDYRAPQNEQRDYRAPQNEQRDYRAPQNEPREYRPPQNEFKPPQEGRGAREEINYHEYTEYAMETLLNLDEIGTVMLLYRNCVRMYREYSEKSGKAYDEVTREKIIKKMMLVILNTFFKPQSSLSPEAIVDDCGKNGTVRLTKQ